MTIALEAALVKIFITAIICLFIYLTINMVLRWIRQMAEDGLPMFTHGSLEWKPNSDKEETKPPIGFNPPTEGVTSEAEPKEVEEKQPTSEEAKEILRSDPIMLCAALLRGEVDVDEFTRK